MSEINFKILYVGKKNSHSKIYKTEIVLADPLNVEMKRLLHVKKNKNSFFNKILRLIK